MRGVEGVEVGGRGLVRWVIPLTLLILVGLFYFQSRGTALIGAVFGPIMMVWFAVIAALGLIQIVQDPAVLSAMSPYHAIRVFTENITHAFVWLPPLSLSS